MMSKKILLICGLITALGGAAAVLSNFDSRYAKAAYMETCMSNVEIYIQQVDKRLEQKIDKDRKNELLELMWKLENRWTPIFQEEFNRLPHDIDELVRFMPEVPREMYRKAELEYKELEKKGNKDA